MKAGTRKDQWEEFSIMDDCVAFGSNPPVEACMFSWACSRARTHSRNLSKFSFFLV
jgi:hypothetical protein